MTATLRTVPVVGPATPARRRRKPAPAVVRRLAYVGAIGGQAGGGVLHSLNKADRPAVEVPRGEGAVARAMAARFGCTRVVLVYEDGTAHERSAKGTGRPTLSAMGRFLVEQAK